MFIFDLLIYNISSRYIKHICLPLSFLKQLDALIGSMNTKGVRERALKKQLQKFYNKIWSVNLVVHGKTSLHKSSCNCSYGRSHILIAI